MRYYYYLLSHTLMLICIDIINNVYIIATLAGELLARRHASNVNIRIYNIITYIIVS